jgi:hypothetical protein
MTATPAEKNVLTVLESCFKIVPGMEAELVELQGRLWPVATSQPGFISVQVGTIVKARTLASKSPSTASRDREPSIGTDFGGGFLQARGENRARG